mmetsp:Transcript_14003/g.18190  ORF Transcript_14003/g.18190 Transcript_14003/m.18190 type:complete len:467 (+) Transcript_14003:93-1493(+)
MKLFHLYFLLLLQESYAASVLNFDEDYSILNYGAVANDMSNEACYANSIAIENALYAANETAGTVIIPENMEFCIFTSEVNQLHNVTFQIDGKLTISNNITEWLTNIQTFTAALNFIECRGFTMNGHGILNGQGHDWWWANIIDGINRPHIFFCSESQDVLIQDVHFENSPKFHCRVYDTHRLHIHNIDIYVDVKGQEKMLKQNNLWYYFPDDHQQKLQQQLQHPASSSLSQENNGILDGIPVFPVNTDGIDVSGNNILIENITIQNFDDAVVIKPSDQNSYWGPCSTNVLVKNVNVSYSVGMSIGSISPSINVECISNIMFENINFIYPFKAIYIKTNPGNDGTAIVNNITYENINVKGALWYAIWIGPQQETTGVGEASCSFLYPLSLNCPTQPLVTISNILLQNVNIDGGIFIPGVILGNETNPISNMVFNNVQNTGKFIISDDYACEEIMGQSINSNPIPCF